MRILITGAAGYIGGMLVDQFKNGPDVQILALDRLDQPKSLEHPRVTWCVSDLAKQDWHNILGSVKPDVVIHAAWGHSQNEKLAMNIFDFCIRHKIPKFIYLSSIDGYGTASSTAYIENDPLRASGDAYSEEVVHTENAIKKLYGGSQKQTQTFILRLPIIFGPRAWQLEHFFGTLAFFKSGSLPLMIADSESLVFQALHEDDLIDVLGLLTFNKMPDRYEVFNVAPEDAVRASGIATIFGRKLMPVSKAIQKLVPFDRSPRLMHSILVEGSKLVKKFKYHYSYSSYEALTTDEGRYGIEAN